MVLANFGLPAPPMKSLPEVQNNLRAATNALQTLDAEVSRPVREQLVIAGEHLTSIDKGLLRPTERRVLRAFQALQGIDGQMRAGAESAVETARSLLSSLPGPAVAVGGNGSGPPPRPSTCNFAYLILRWPAGQQVFPCPAIDTDQFQTCPAPDRIFAACFSIRQALHHYTVSDGFQWYLWREITMKRYDELLTQFGHVLADDASLLQRALNVEVGNA